MAGKRSETRDDGKFRALVGRAADETSLRRVVADAGLDLGADYQAVHRWYEGRSNREGDQYRCALKGSRRDKLFAHLRRKYPSDFDSAERKAKLAKLARSGTRLPSDGTREWFAEILRREGCTEFTAWEVRAGEHYTWSPPGGLSEEDCVAFAPALGKEDLEVLRCMIEKNNRRRAR